MRHEHSPVIYPPECTRAAAHLRRLKTCDEASKLIIAEAESALTLAALELHFLETLMRTAQQTLADLLADDKAKRLALESAQADLASATEANAQFQAANADLQKQVDDLTAAGVANPDDTIKPDNPARVEANAMLDADHPAIRQ